MVCPISNSAHMNTWWDNFRLVAPLKGYFFFSINKCIEGKHSFVWHCHSLEIFFTWKYLIPKAIVLTDTATLDGIDRYFVAVVERLTSYSHRIGLISIKVGFAEQASHFALRCVCHLTFRLPCGDEQRFWFPHQKLSALFFMLLLVPVHLVTLVWILTCFVEKVIIFCSC